MESAKTILDRAGLTAETAKQSTAGKMLQEMSLDELNQFISQGQAKLQQLQQSDKTIEGEFAQVDSD